MRRYIGLAAIVVWPAILPAADAPLLAPQQDTTRQGAAKASPKGGAQKGASTKGAPKAEKAPRTPAQDSARFRERAEKAVALPLFASHEPLPFTLIANYTLIGRDRDSTSKRRYPGTLVVTDDAGAERRLPVQLRTRGHYRLQRNVCSFVNLLVIFPKDGLKGTPFHGQESLKLGAHCRSDPQYDQYTLREHAAYRVFNAVTERSFRTRLSRGTYIDSASGKTLDTRVAMWIENEDDVAARLMGRLREYRRALFADVDAETLDHMTIFEYAIGNTDWSISALHNVRLVQTIDGTFLPVPYDFDFSGLVNTRYATPDPQLHIRRVRERLFRGPCRTPAEMEARVAHWRERREAILAALDVPGLRERELNDARGYMEEFFRTTNDARAVRRDLVDGCLRMPGA